MALDNLFVHFASSCRCMDTLLTHTLIPIVISEHTVYWFCTIRFGQRYLRLTTYCTFTLLSYSLFIRFTYVMCRIQERNKKSLLNPYKHGKRWKMMTLVKNHEWKKKHYTLCVLPKA
jgi:hypothetical protein